MSRMSANGVELLSVRNNWCKYERIHKRLHTSRTTDYRHARQDRWIQTELVSTLAKNAIKPNPFEIVLLQTTRKENNWKTEETLDRAAVTLETERIKGSSTWCLWWWWWWWWWTYPLWLMIRAGELSDHHDWFWFMTPCNFVDTETSKEFWLPWGRRFHPNW